MSEPYIVELPMGSRFVLSRSYPLMYLAKIYCLDYRDVLLFADSQKADAEQRPFTVWERIGRANVLRALDQTGLYFGFRNAVLDILSWLK